MENRKVSFGFSKVTKKHEIVTKAPKNEEKQVELIDCLEGQSIKIKNAVEEIEKPLIIPIKESTKNLIDRVKEAKEKRIKNEIKEEEVPDSELSVDELAARELIREARNRDTVKNESKIYSLPLKEEKLILEGEPEPSLEDYDNVPISDYGMAMLRGMGWKEGMGIGKTHRKTVTPILPELRPKGLGLGANKLASKSTKVTDKDGKELQIVKGGFGKIIDGRHKGHYCEIQGVDMETSRCIVRISLTNDILSLHEYLIVPVTKEEYGLGSKVLNNAKYEEYKEKTSVRSRSEERARSNGRNRSRSRDKHRKKKIHEEGDSDSSKSRKEKSRKSNKTEGERRRRRSKKKHKSRYKSGGSDDDHKKYDDEKHGR